MNSDIVNLSIDLRFCRICYHDSDWIERKTKCDYTLWNIISGEIELEMEGKKYTAGPGEVLLFHPGDTYQAWCLSDGCSFLVTFFSLYSGNKVDLVGTGHNSGVYKSSGVKKISKEFTDEYQKKYVSLKNPNLGLYAAFLSFYANLAEHFGEQESFTMSNETEELPKLTRLIEYIDSHLDKDITVKELAEKMSMSEKYFSSYFHVHMGMSPKQYLVKSRMNYAARLLADPDMSLKNIASILQFSDQYSFAKAFKNYYGEAPGTFRKTFLQQG